MFSPDLATRPRAHWLDSFIFKAEEKEKFVILATHHDNIGPTIFRTVQKEILLKNTETEWLTLQNLPNTFFLVRRNKYS